MAETQNRLSLIIHLARLHFMLPALLVYLLGVEFAVVIGYSISIEKILFGYLIFLFAQLSLNISNDYFDFESDKNSERTYLSGGSGVLVVHPELKPIARNLAILFLVASIGSAFLFMLIYSYELSFLIFVSLGALLGWFYSAPPLRLSYRGLGEVSTAIAIGLLMPGMGYYVVAGHIDSWFILLSFPLSLYGFFFIFTVELPDVDSDRISKRLNLAVIKGIPVTLKMCLVVTLLGCIILLSFSFLNLEGQANLMLFLTIISLLPLAGAIAGIGQNPEKRRNVPKQAKVNLGTMILFLAFADFCIPILF